MTDYPDGELVRLAQGGDTQAFGVLAERYGKSLISYTRAKVRSWADAQDIVQDTLIDALKGLGGFDLERPFRPWLRAICRNRLSRHYRTQARQ